MKTITWRHFEIIYRNGKIDIFKFSFNTPGEVGRKPFRLACDVEFKLRPIETMLLHLFDKPMIPCYPIGEQVGGAVVFFSAICVLVGFVGVNIPFIKMAFVHWQYPC